MFIDSTGSEWQVWDIVPRLSERRASPQRERRVAIIPIPFGDRRSGNDQRQPTQARRAVLRGSYAQGWLCFDNSYEKRRLTPIPADWSTCSEQQLEVYAHRAEPVASGQRVAGFRSTGEDLADTG
jgi:hypothetical protein